MPFAYRHTVAWSRHFSGKVPQNDIVPANKVNQILEKVPPEDEFLQIAIGEIEDYNEKDKNKKK
jgi:hypothetical protein